MTRWQPTSSAALNGMQVKKIFAQAQVSKKQSQPLIEKRQQDLQV